MNLSDFFSADQDNGEEWICLCDFMMNFVMVALVIGVYAIDKLPLAKMKAYDDATKASKTARLKINESIESTFHEEIEKGSLNFSREDSKLSVPDSFKTGTSTLPKGMEEWLEQKFPTVVHEIFVARKKKELGENYLESIQINGHTDSTIPEGKTQEEGFQLNMKLSQERAANILYFLRSKKDKFKSEQEYVWFISVASTAGYASSRPIHKLNTQEENLTASRRIEIIFNPNLKNTQSVLQAAIGGGKK